MSSNQTLDDASSGVLLSSLQALQARLRSLQSAQLKPAGPSDVDPDDEGGAGGGGGGNPRVRVSSSWGAAASSRSLLHKALTSQDSKKLSVQVRYWVVSW